MVVVTTPDGGFDSRSHLRSTYTDHSCEWVVPTVYSLKTPCTTDRRAAAKPALRSDARTASGGTQSAIMSQKNRIKSAAEEPRVAMRTTSGTTGPKQVRASARASGDACGGISTRHQRAPALTARPATANGGPSA